jgi:hypothetical protein
MNEWLITLMVGAAAVGSLHTMAPDHWVPFAVLGKARGWNNWKTARLTFFCAFGHVTVSALLGIFALMLGQGAVERFGTSLHAHASLLLIGFGTAYLVYGLWRTFRGKIMHHVDHLQGRSHDHGDGQGHHHHHRAGLTEWGLFLLYCADPCVALIPMIMAASVGGWPAVFGLIAVYEVATILTMVVVVQAATAGVTRLHLPWLDRYSHVVAGALILILGTVVTVLEHHH